MTIERTYAVNRLRTCVTYSPQVTVQDLSELPSRMDLSPSQLLLEHANIDRFVMVSTAL